MSLIAITGGIGAGKSVVSRMLRAMSYDVYDCDSEAKRLMQSSDDIKRGIVEEIDAAAVDCDGNIIRERLAAVVFADTVKLKCLNRIVHRHVRMDLSRWYESVGHPDGRPVFVETAIMYESGLDMMVGCEWRVTADAETRIARVMMRNGLSRHEVERRIASQSSNAGDGHVPVCEIVNDGRNPVLPQVLELLRDGRFGQ